MAAEEVNNLPEPSGRRHLDKLSPDEKATIAHDCFKDYSQGFTWKSMTDKWQITRHAAQVLVAEYAAMVREARPDTKTANEEAYRHILQKSMEIIDRDESVGDKDQRTPVLVKAKAFEAAIQSLTRLDKLGGHEAPNVNVNLEGQNLAQIIDNIYGPDGPMAGVSPEDNARIHEAEQKEDIQDADIVPDEGEGGEIVDHGSDDEQEERPAD